MHNFISKCYVILNGAVNINEWGPIKFSRDGKRAMKLKRFCRSERINIQYFPHIKTISSVIHSRNLSSRSGIFGQQTIAAQQWGVRAAPCRTHIPTSRNARNLSGFYEVLRDVIFFQIFALKTHHCTLYPLMKSKSDTFIQYTKKLNSSEPFPALKRLLSKTVPVAFMVTFSPRQYRKKCANCSFANEMATTLLSELVEQSVM